MRLCHHARSFRRVEFGELEERMREFPRDKARRLFGRTRTMGNATVRVIEPPIAVIGESMTISNAEGADVLLVEVLPAASPTFEPQSAADILCLDLHKFGLGSAIHWVEQAQSRIEDDELPLCIVAIGNEKVLSVKDLWRVSAELEPAGAIFHRWPENCESFAEAFRRFGESVKSIYGPLT